MRFGGLLKRAGFGAFSTAVYWLGVLLNIIVMKKNGGYMPVYAKDCIEGVVINAQHICPNTSTHLRFLADWIHIGAYLYSPGDMLIYSGNFLQVIFVGSLVFWAFKTLDRWLS